VEVVTVNDEIVEVKQEQFKFEVEAVDLSD
jgi:hypothetical protein